MTINQFFAKLRASGIRFCVKKDGAIRRYGRQDVCPIAALGKTTTNGYLDAAVDLGVIRARVCDPSSLLLSNRHAGVRAAAERKCR